MNFELSQITVDYLQRYREARIAYVGLGRDSGRTLADDVNAQYRSALEGLAYSLVADQDRQLAAQDRITDSLRNTFSPAALVEALDNELDALRRDADRFRVLREYWVRIEGVTTAQRAVGLDHWCDERLAAVEDPPPKT